MPRKTVPAKFSFSDSDHAHFKALVERLDARTPQHTRKALIAACPPALIGTAWDPVVADGSPVLSAVKAEHNEAMIKRWQRWSTRASSR
jgi:hypothetical protein